MAKLSKVQIESMDSLLSTDGQKDVPRTLGSCRVTTIERLRAEKLIQTWDVDPVTYSECFKRRYRLWVLTESGKEIVRSWRADRASKLEVLLSGRS